MTAHTPGPWKVVENKRERTVQIDTETGTVVNPGAISWIPDARLIAAAPTMRDWISLTVRTLNDRLEVLEEAKNAKLHGAEAAHEVLRDQRDKGAKLLREIDK